MGIQDVRNAFLHEGNGKLRVNDCKLSTIQDGNNSQRLQIIGFDMNGAVFELDSGPFDPKVSPTVKAQEMARGVLSKPAGFSKPPTAAP